MYVLGIDVGTTGTKALLIKADGEVAGRGYQGYELITGSVGVVEQDADAWWQAAGSVPRRPELEPLPDSADGLADVRSAPCV